MVAEGWAGGEVTYSVSNQYAMWLLATLIFDGDKVAALARMHQIDRPTIESALAIMRGPTPRREIVIFTPDEIQAALDKNLAAGLRQLADAIERGAIDGKVLDCKANGFTAKGDERAHVMLRIDLAAPIRQTFLEGESREEFERDRMGQTGEDNARKMFGEKEKS
jgi:hypothetical protein